MRSMKSTASSMRSARTTLSGRSSPTTVLDEAPREVRNAILHEEDPDVFPSFTPYVSARSRSLAAHRHTCVSGSEQREGTGLWLCKATLKVRLLTLASQPVERSWRRT